MSVEIIEYLDEFGPVEWQPGFADELKGKSIDEQIECFAISSYSFRDCTFDTLRTYSGSIEWEDIRKELTDIKDSGRLLGIIVKDGLIVGFRLNTYGGERNVLAPGSFCVDYTCDNNGAGYKERYWYEYLICLPSGHPPIR